MKNIFLLIALLTAVPPLLGQIFEGKSPEELNKGGGKLVPVLAHRMTPEELNTFEKRRISGEMMGSFESYTGLLWAVYGVGIWSEGTGVSSSPVQSPYSKDYKPTWQELLDVLARQVKCSWHYNHDTGYFVFEEKTMELPFALTTAKDWTLRDDGQSVVYIPPIAPVGMDVYLMGHYSADDPAKLPEVFAKARNDVSMLFAKNFKPDVTEKDFIPDTVSGEPALYFSAPTPRDPKLTWRQWAFVKDGWCFIIVSVISKDNESRLLPDVKAMIASFKAPSKH